ncbi:MAG: hypothetical protein COA32_16425 [Fluviicola sp.]|nr:MAG: hypothetical protein COA32_16425 [Fluviicola sp.]
MKRFYILASALLAVTNLKAQFTTVDFEDLTLPAVDTFYNGADGAGQFTSNSAVFGNSFEDFGTYIVWSGFAYSNMTDNTTAGFGNQYSSFAGVGADNSENYAVYNSGDTLYLPGSSNFGNVSIVNTTYTGISMRDGDQFAKQFGSPLDANGDPDGTNGEDYFYVTVYGWDDNDVLVDSSEIYLADYRSADANDHYILEEWTEFNLSSLDGSSYLTFGFTSSDVGQWGINTPLYFAMDNLEYQAADASLAENEIDFSVYPNPVNDKLTIDSKAGIIKLIDLNGKVVFMKNHNAISTIEVSTLPKGLYLIHLQTDNQITTKKIVITK